jgi:hypothetical protein
LQIENQSYPISTGLRPRVVHAGGLPHSSVRVGTSQYGQQDFFN